MDKYWRHAGEFETDGQFKTEFYRQTALEWRMANIKSKWWISSCEMLPGPRTLTEGSGGGPATHRDTHKD